MAWLSNLQEMTGEYEEKKAAYENLAAGLESNMSKLEQVIETLIHSLTHPSLKFKDEVPPSIPVYVHVCVDVAVHIAIFVRKVRV